jgi:hypothetical protein
MQPLHRPVLRPITLSPPTVRALRRNRWQPASTNLLIENQRGYVPFPRTLAALFPPPLLQLRSEYLRPSISKSLVHGH